MTCALCFLLKIIPQPKNSNQHPDDEYTRESITNWNSSLEGYEESKFFLSWSCAGSCEPGSRCCPNECIFGGEKPRGVRVSELGVYEQGKGNGEFSLQAIGDRGGRILSQQGGFQVSERGLERGISKGRRYARGTRMYIVICVRVCT